MEYTIRFQYFGENTQLEREFNIDSIGVLYKFQQIDEFRKAIKLFSNEKIRFNNNNYISKGGTFDISDKESLSYVGFIKHEDEYIIKDKGGDDIDSLFDLDLFE